METARWQRSTRLCAASRFSRSRWRAAGLPWYSVASRLGFSRMAGPKVLVAIENEPLLRDRAPSRSTPTTRLHKSNPKDRRLRQTYSSGVLLVLGALNQKPSLI